MLVPYRENNSHFSLNVILSRFFLRCFLPQGQNHTNKPLLIRHLMVCLDYKLKM